MAQASRRQFLSNLALSASEGASRWSRPKHSLKELRQALRGIHSYLPTPFHSNLKIDPEGMHQNAAYYAKAGLENFSLVVAAGLGELFALDFEEHRAVVSAAVAGAEGRLAVVAGVRGGYRFALRMARTAEEAGADAILVFPPPGGPQTIEGQQQYYREIARSVGIGVLIYPRTQKDDWSTLLAELVDQANILGFKDGSGGIALGQSLGPLIRDRLVWTARGEEHALRALAGRGHGLCHFFCLSGPQGLPRILEAGHPRRRQGHGERPEGTHRSPG